MGALDHERFSERKAEESSLILTDSGPTGARREVYIPLWVRALRRLAPSAVMSLTSCCSRSEFAWERSAAQISVFERLLDHFAKIEGFSVFGVALLGKRDQR